MTMEDREAYARMRRVAVSQLKINLQADSFPEHGQQIPNVDLVEDLDFPSESAFVPTTILPFDPKYVVPKTGINPCDALECSRIQNDHNRRVAILTRRRAERAKAIEAASNNINADSTSGRAVEQAIAAFNSSPTGGSYYVCSPSGDEVRREIDAHNIAVDTAGRAAIRASRQLLDNGQTRLEEMSNLAREVAQKRQAFESTSGGEGVSGIERAHEAFRIVSDALRQFYFGNWYPHHNNKAAEFWVRYTDAHNAEAEDSAITELDRIRDEYVTRRRPVPLVTEFTQSKRSPNFSFSELNSGDYSWAVITDDLLSKLEAVRELVGNRPLRVLSGYRNPRKNDNLPGSSSTSRHQYGDAADVLPLVDLTGDGVINAQDRDLLANAAERAGFNEVIPKRHIAVHMATESENSNIRSIDY